MSRQINMDSLSKEDVRYLADRGRLTPSQEAQYRQELKDTTPPQAPNPLLQPTVGDVGTAEAALGGIVNPDTDVPPYHEWTKKDLVSEIDTRNEGRSEENQISNKGTIRDLADRLEADDENNE